jgi:Transposase IS116/IS110/IS902 family
MKRTPHFPQHNAEAVLVASKLSNAEARFVVSDYIAAQEARKRADMQLRHLGDKADAVANAGLLNYAASCNAEMEKTILRALERFAASSPVGAWMLAQHGVGPVIAAGMLAHLDIEQAPTAGHFWRFAGLDPSCKWEKGEKRPYNAALKQLCFHLGECVKRTSNADESVYGKIYRERKAFLVERNEAGHNAERAKVFFTKSADVRKTLASGKLPAGNLDRQACNYAAKIFLSHLHAVMYFDRYRKAPPKPFAIQHMGHAHEIRVPMTEMFPGFASAYYGEAEALQAAE